MTTILQIDIRPSIFLRKCVHERCLEKNFTVSGVFSFPHSDSIGDVMLPTNTIGPIDTMDAIFLANFESSEAMANGSMPP